MLDGFVTKFLNDTSIEQPTSSVSRGHEAHQPRYKNVELGYWNKMKMHNNIAPCVILLILKINKALNNRICT